MVMQESNYISALIAGGGAGLAVDLTLFPLDTIKTRLQSSQGFLKAKGFQGIYAGLGSAAAGSVPSAALFFCTYEAVKNTLGKKAHKNEKLLPVIHMAAASAGEVVASLVRVPSEVIKQRAQAEMSLTTRQHALRTFQVEGFRGFYRGYFNTVLREIPFSLIQFPLWEYLKLKWSQSQGHPVLPWQSAVAGASAGAVAAAITTPLDVVKTRIMLAKAGSKEATATTATLLNIIYRDRGLNGLFAGILPRVTWISIGGFIFLGIYAQIRHTLDGPTDQNI